MDKQTHFCPFCDAYITTHTEMRHEQYPVRGIEIEVDAEVRICDMCGNSISDQKLDDHANQRF